ncbi:GLPGLI family protein [Nitritalea halalkaliphila]|nr:GLPGLI family protein [Nitritalea halalkaliphila]
MDCLMEVFLVLGGKENYILKMYALSKLNEYVNDHYGDYYLIEDDLGIMEWEIGDEKKTILGFTCVKATTFFRGRHYEAWFSPEIPFSTGPWKADGLPGLILELREENGMLHFTASKINFHEELVELPVPTFKNVKKISARQFSDLVWKQAEEKFKFIEAQLRKEGSNITITVNRPKDESLEIFDEH